MKRVGKKFWNANEKSVLQKLGLKPTPASGAGVALKEDGYNDYVLCQLKSTIKDSVSVKRQDVETLIYNANMSRKIPVFVIQFVEGYTLVATLPDQLENIGKFLDGQVEKISVIDVPKSEPTLKKKRTSIGKNTSWTRREEQEAPKTIAEIRERRKKR